MKKILFLFIAALFAVACEESGTTPDPNTSYEVSFTSSISTRLSESAFETGDVISVTAIDAYDVTYAENIEYTFASNLFSSTTPIEYYNEEHSLSYRAVYPCLEVPKTGEVTFSVSEDQTSSANYQNSDLMSSFVELTSSTQPELAFDHLLSQVIITITSSPTSTQGATVDLDVLKTTEFNILTNASEATGSAASVAMYGEGDGSFKAIIVPQEVAAGEVFAVVTVDGTQYDMIFDEAKTYASGKKYEYEISLSEDGITFKETINDWVEDSNDTMGYITSVTINEVRFEEAIYSVTVDENYNGTYLVVPLSLTTLDESFGGSEEAYANYYISYLNDSGFAPNVVNDVFSFTGDLVDKNIFDAWDIPTYTECKIMAFGVSSSLTINTDIALSDIFITAAETSDNPDDVVFPDVEFGSVSVTPYMRSVKTTMIPNDNDVYYITFVAQEYITNTYKTDEALYTYILSDVETFLNYYGLTVQDGLPYVAYKGTQSIDINNLEYDTPYTLVIVSVDAETLQPAAKLDKTEFRTLPWTDIDAELESISISDISCTNALATIKVGEYIAPYFVVNIDENSFESVYNSDLEAMFNGILATAPTDLGITDYNLVDNYFIFEGNASFYIGYPWDVDPEANYVAAAAGIDSLGMITTDIISTSWTSASVPDTFNIDVTFADEYAAPTTLMVHSTPTLSNLATLVFLLETSDFEQFNSDEELVEAVLANQSSASNFIKYGERYDQYLNLTSGTSYTAIAFGYSMDGPGLVTKVFSAECETESYEIPTDFDCPDVDFGEMNLLGITSTTIAVEILPTDKSMTYLKGKMTTEQFNSFSSQEALIMSELDMYTDYAEQLGMDLLNLLTYVYSYTGDIPNSSISVNHGLYEFLTPGVSYTFYAYGFDCTSLLPLTQVEFIEGVPTDDASSVIADTRPAADPLADFKALIGAKANEPMVVYTPVADASAVTSKPEGRDLCLVSSEPVAKQNSTLTTESYNVEGGSVLSVRAGQLKNFSTSKVVEIKGKF